MTVMKCPHCGSGCSSRKALYLHMLANKESHPIPDDFTVFCTHPDCRFASPPSNMENHARNKKHQDYLVPVTDELLNAPRTCVHTPVQRKRPRPEGLSRPKMDVDVAQSEAESLRQQLAQAIQQLTQVRQELQVKSLECDSYKHQLQQHRQQDQMQALLRQQRQQLQQLQQHQQQQHQQHQLHMYEQNPPPNLIAAPYEQKHLVHAPPNLVAAPTTIPVRTMGLSDPLVSEDGLNALLFEPMDFESLVEFQSSQPASELVPDFNMFDTLPNLQETNSTHS